MTSLRLMNAAREELAELWNHIALDNGDTVADQQIDRIYDAMDTLRRYPDSGRQRPELREAVRSYAVRPYVVFYLVDELGIAVLHVVRGSRDLPSVFEFD